MTSIIQLVTIWFCMLNVSRASDFKDTLVRAEKAVDESLAAIFARWEIDKYPSFLKSGSMQRHSWDFLKLKYKDKILAAQSTGKTQNFTICFTGSSVTAGHDSPFNKSFAPLTGMIMSPVLKALNVHVDLRPVALGNNPCFPYDVCVRTFCGDDVDLIHWEQSYFCGFNHDHNPTLEMFIRQSMVMKSNPVVIFADSATDNWESKDCPKPVVPYVVTSEEKDMLRASTVTIATEINKGEYHIPGELSKAYKAAGLQYWYHAHYHRQYKCQGPYHKDWGVGTVSWHPSISGHQLRADHHSYFWMSAWRDSIADVLRLTSASPSPSVTALLADNTKHIQSIITLHPMPPTPVHKTAVTDNIQCFTDYEPRWNRAASIRNMIVAGLAKDKDSPGWKAIILEMLLGDENYKHIDIRHKKAGYVDYKHMYTADYDAGPLSLKISVQKEGVIYICEPTGFFGQTAGGAEHIWKLNPGLYLTSQTPDLSSSSFVFDQSKATIVPYQHTTATGGGGGETCVQTTAPVAAGSYIITIVPTHEKGKKMMLATILIP
eukprot:CAMPEP_0182423426 /NCGR_PEP_ID=MMETSP1167-20130531/9394_1 /TAXON_ID=2988 /ORGANISM="Mallomonas Sp, Strain CCMP3275" /LENGTH=545 /DNA_ID=CAMNT_0024602391 /DNA_START=70 /DNA_END=1707 /DNA_ORIENTATION=+